MPSPCDPPAELPVRAMTAFLFSFNGDTRRNVVFSKMKELRVKFTWFDVRWSIVQATENTFNWTRHDLLVAGARDIGAQIVLDVNLCPGWANGNAGDLTPPTNPQDYANFCTYAVQRYKPGGDLSRELGWTDGYGVRHWEIWNEPNLDQNWGGNANAKTYTQMLIPAYIAIHEADPFATVLGGSIEPNFNARPYLNIMYNYGAKGHFDALAIHPFVANSGPVSGVSAHADLMRSVMDLYGDTSDIWGTGVGWNNNFQVARIPPLYNEILPNGKYKMLFWWTSHDELGSDNFFGLFQMTGTGTITGIKPGFYTYRDEIPG